MHIFMSFKLHVLELCSTFGVIKRGKSFHKSSLFASLGVTSSNGTGLRVGKCWGIYFIQGNKHSLLLSRSSILIHCGVIAKDIQRLCTLATMTSPLLTFLIMPVWLHADHPAQGGVAGVQLSSRCRWTLHLHGGGARTEPLLQGRQRPPASPAPGKSRRRRQPHAFTVTPA